MNKPSGMFMPEKKISVETPTITSGSTMGKKLIVCMYILPLNLYQFIPIAASVPSTVATAEESSAIITLLKTASQRLSESQKSFLYQTSEKFVNSLPLL